MSADAKLLAREPTPEMVNAVHAVTSDKYFLTMAPRMWRAMWDVAPAPEPEPFTADDNCDYPPAAAPSAEPVYSIPANSIPQRPAAPGAGAGDDVGRLISGLRRVQDRDVGALCLQAASALARLREECERLRGWKLAAFQTALPGVQSVDDAELWSGRQAGAVVDLFHRAEKAEAERDAAVAELAEAMEYVWAMEAAGIAMESGTKPDVERINAAQAKLKLRHTAIDAARDGSGNG